MVTKEAFIKIPPGRQMRRSPYNGFFKYFTVALVSLFHSVKWEIFLNISLLVMTFSVLNIHLSKCFVYHYWLITQIRSLFMLVFSYPAPACFLTSWLHFKFRRTLGLSILLGYDTVTLVGILLAVCSAHWIFCGLCLLSGYSDKSFLTKNIIILTFFMLVRRVIYFNTVEMNQIYSTNLFKTLKKWMNISFNISE